jgi:hypothetical protein
MRHDRVPFAVDITISHRVVRMRRGDRLRPFVPVAGPGRPAAARERALGPNLHAEFGRYDLYVMIRSGCERATLALSMIIGARRGVEAVICG